MHLSLLGRPTIISLVQMIVPWVLRLIRALAKSAHEFISSPSRRIFRGCFQLPGSLIIPAYAAGFVYHQFQTWKLNQVRYVSEGFNAWDLRLKVAS